MPCSVLYVYGQMRDLPGDPFDTPTGGGTLTTIELEKGYEFVRPTQRSTYKFFAFAIILFLVQVLAGILSAEDFLGGGPGRQVVNFLGIPLTFSITKAWHSIVQIYWFFMCWVGYTIFLPAQAFESSEGSEDPDQPAVRSLRPRGCGRSVRDLFRTAGLHERHDELLVWESGLGVPGARRFWHILMLASFVLWIIIIFRGVRPWITKANLWSVPAWLFYGSGIMVLFLFFGLGATSGGNFAISDYWRWMTVHMWVEVTFEVFTTCIIGYMLVQMGMINRAVAERVIFLAVMMFLVTATVGISHNFYWIGKPTGIIALGSVFSTLQVLPLLLITLDAWRMRKEKLLANENVAQGNQTFVMEGVWMFILAVNFWNIVGAGSLGLVDQSSDHQLLRAFHLPHGQSCSRCHVRSQRQRSPCRPSVCCQHLFPRAQLERGADSKEFLVAADRTLADDASGSVPRWAVSARSRLHPRLLVRQDPTSSSPVKIWVAMTWAPRGRRNSVPRWRRAASSLVHSVEGTHARARSRDRRRRMDRLREGLGVSRRRDLELDEKEVENYRAASSLVARSHQAFSAWGSQRDPQAFLRSPFDTPGRSAGLAGKRASRCGGGWLTLAER